MPVARACCSGSFNKVCVSTFTSRVLCSSKEDGSNKSLSKWLRRHGCQAVSVFVVPLDTTGCRAGGGLLRGEEMAFLPLIAQSYTPKKALHCANQWSLETDGYCIGNKHSKQRRLAFNGHVVYRSKDQLLPSFKLTKKSYGRNLTSETMFTAFTARCNPHFIPLEFCTDFKKLQITAHIR